jgi:hypothetical protein
MTGAALLYGKHLLGERSPGIGLRDTDEIAAAPWKLAALCGLKPFCLTVTAPFWSAIIRFGVV